MSNELSDLAAAHAALVDARDSERAIVHRARRAGFRWADIARTLGIPVSTTQSRYGKDAPEPEGLPGHSVAEYAARIHPSTSYIYKHLDEFKHVVVEVRGVRHIRILEDA